MKKITILTLGCPKNIVDSEKIISALPNDFLFTEDVNDADIILLNTCGFIKSALDETIEYIHKLEKLVKQKSKNKKIKNVSIPNIIVFGCAVSRLLNEGIDLKKNFPFVNEFISLTDLDSIIEKILNITNLSNNKKKNTLENIIRNANITSPYYAYLKISDGCNRSCSFCTIPSIKGKYKSIPKDILIKESENLVSKGIKEIILIGQETTNYGIDINTTFYDLLDNLSNIKNLKWIRIMYTHPASFDLRILDLMKERENICRYIDIPLQHIDEDILNKMKRNIKPTKIKELILEMRQRIPDIHIRTSFITGFPSENIQQHNKLLKYIKQTKFNRLGVFKYSTETNTDAYYIKPQIDENIKQERFDELMLAQQKISLANNKKMIGKKVRVLIEDDYDDKYYIGRTEYDAPDIDNCVYIKKKKGIVIGNIIDVEVYNASEYAIYGKF